MRFHLPMLAKTLRGHGRVVRRAGGPGPAGVPADDGDDRARAAGRRRRLALPRVEDGRGDVTLGARDHLEPRARARGAQGGMRRRPDEAVCAEPAVRADRLAPALARQGAAGTRHVAARDGPPTVIDRVASRDAGTNVCATDACCPSCAAGRRRQLRRGEPSPDVVRLPALRPGVDGADHDGGESSSPAPPSTSGAAARVSGHVPLAPFHDAADL